MWCTRCQKHLSQCTCADLEERLNSVVDEGNFVYKYCKKCNKHYERCKCEHPEFAVKNKEVSNGSTKKNNEA